jgi:dipeptidyl-peptidase-4
MSDQRDGVRYLRSLPFVDKARIGICGWGYGGYLVTHAMLDLPIIYKAGFAGAPVTDWLQYDAVFAERYLEDPVRNADGYDASSPLDNTPNLKTPFLITQGTADESVHQDQLYPLLKGLMKSGKSPDLLLLPDQGHEIEEPPAKLTLYRRMTEFFLKNL